MEKLVEKKKKSVTKKTWEEEIEKLHSSLVQAIESLPQKIEGEGREWLEQYVEMRKKIEIYEAILDKMKEPHVIALAKIRRDEALSVGTMEKFLSALKPLILQKRELEIRERKLLRDKEIQEWREKGGDSLNVPAIREDVPSSYKIGGVTLYFISHKDFFVEGSREKREKIYRNDERVKNIPDECFVLDYVRLGAKITSGEKYEGVVVREGETIGVKKTTEEK